MTNPRLVHNLLQINDHNKTSKAEKLHEVWTGVNYVSCILVYNKSYEKEIAVFPYP